MGSSGQSPLAKRVWMANRALDAGRSPSIPNSSPFRLLARTCPKCGELVTTPYDRIRKSAWPRLDNCPCIIRASVTGQAVKVATDESYRKRIRHQLSAAAIRANNLTRDTARNHGKEWTGPELELAARLELSASEVARMLGRTINAVRTVRDGMRRGDPRRDPKISRADRRRA